MDPEDMLAEILSNEIDTEILCNILSANGASEEKIKEIKERAEERNSNRIFRKLYLTDKIIHGNIDK